MIRLETRLPTVDAYEVLFFLAFPDPRLAICNAKLVQILQPVRFNSIMLLVIAAHKKFLC